MRLPLKDVVATQEMGDLCVSKMVTPIYTQGLLFLILKRSRGNSENFVSIGRYNRMCFDQ